MKYIFKISILLQRLQERDERKQAYKERKEEEAILKLLEVIKAMIRNLYLLFYDVIYLLFL